MTSHNIFAILSALVEGDQDAQVVASEALATQIRKVHPVPVEWAVESTAHYEYGEQVERQICENIAATVDRLGYNYAPGICGRKITEDCRVVRASFAHRGSQEDHYIIHAEVVFEDREFHYGAVLSFWSESIRVDPLYELTPYSKYKLCVKQGLASQFGGAEVNVEQYMQIVQALNPQFCKCFLRDSLTSGETKTD